MSGFLFVFVFAAILVGIMMAAGLYQADSKLPHIILGGYFLRLALQLVVHNVQLFSHDVGGDYILYEMLAKAIAFLWEHDGFQYVSAAQLPELGPTSLPANLFAFVFYFCDDVSGRTACTALIALAAAITVINIYALAIQFGATRQSAMTFALLFYFQPSFLYYTSDLFKDGLVLCFEMAALGSALRLSRRFSVGHVLIGLLSLLGLWFVRYYLCFVTAFTMLVGFIGVGAKKNVIRSGIAIAFIIVGIIFLAVYSNILTAVTQEANTTFEHGTNALITADNATGGSGVRFDDGGRPFGALHMKLLYTLFSPFLWAGGSFGFQVAKLDVLVWYYVMYRAYRAVRTADRQFVAMVATFLLPCTIMYATSMANVGLIVRQRLVIVAATFLLAATYRPAKQSVTIVTLTNPILQRVRAANRARSSLSRPAR